MRWWPKINRTIAVFVLLALGHSFCPLYSRESNNSSPEKFQVYQSLSPEKSLLTSPQFVVIDDFNSGKLKNRRGESWQTKTPGIGALDIELDKSDARKQKSGYSLKATFNLNPNESASVRSLLKGLDISQARFFVFKYKYQTSDRSLFSGRLRVTITDWKHHTVTQDITKLCPIYPGEWGDVIIPIASFGALDLDQLLSIEFRLMARNQKIRGTLSIDEIAFFGFNDMAFESQRDNLVGFPKTIINSKRRLRLEGETEDTILLKGIAFDTWKFFENARDQKTHLIVDHLRVGDAPLAADYTSPTNIAMDLLATVAAMDFEFISRKDAIKRLKNVFTTLEEMRRYKGFFYNFYNTKRLNITRSYLSSVDSGWLAIALVVIRQAFPNELGKRATQFLDSFNFGEFLDPENNQLVVGFEIPERNFGNYHYGLLSTEARATSFYAIGKGDVPRDHWWFLYRTPPKTWKWQNQKPKGKYITYEGVDVFQGFYKYGRKEFVPSWGGSLFEFLMPTLVIKERELAPHGLGLNNRIATEIQRDYALNEKKYPIWGISPASTTNGRQWRYGEYGIKALGAKGYPDAGIITPHVSFLALDSLPEDAIANIRKLLSFNEMYGEYGFYDSINLRNKKVNYQYLTLDQGMIFVAICNYLNKGSIQERFHADPVAKKAQDLLMKESFFNT